MEENIDKYVSWETLVKHYWKRKRALELAHILFLSITTSEIHHAEPSDEMWYEIGVWQVFWEELW